ncbi:MAG: SDR family NAD(P)-dependent oxidoreductase [Nocardioides sp.]|uniref:SDR family NAD(P)-dependent oxidoreductase n=1 Tax=Nocardioides sp. TaxID=35761 RepID=UPI0039E4A08C
MQDLNGKVAVVTGGASGIGLALGRRCVEAGMRVALADVDAEAVETAAAGLSGYGDVIGVTADVAEPEQVEAIAAATRAAFGEFHLVCLNAGVAAGGVSWELDPKAWRWVLEVNLWGVIHGIRTFVPALVDQGIGHVVLTSSIGGLIGSPGMAPYSASKHAVVGVGESLREDLRLARSPVGVTLLCPGFTSTRMNDSGRNWPGRLGEPPASGLEPGHPLTRPEFLARMDAAADPDEVASAALDAVRADRFWAVTDRALPDRLRAHLAPIIAPAAPGGDEGQ